MTSLLESIKFAIRPSVGSASILSAYDEIAATTTSDMPI